MLALVMTLGLTMADTATAAATDYDVNFTQACKWQYGGPQYYAANAFGGPYGWTCYYNTYSLPLSVTFTPAGGLDLNAYCTRAYPGSRAVLAYYHPFGWRCRR